MNIIIRKKSRILCPSEFKKLRDAIPKDDYKDKLEALLFTGARFEEMKNLYTGKYNDKFDGRSIEMHSTKPKSKDKERTIRLNPQGRRAVRAFLKCKTNLPDHTTWRRNLKRWAKLAHLDPKGLGTKSTRKTFESWLIATYGESYTNVIKILQSQGHSEKTAINHYFGLDFTEEDKIEMREFVENWI